jgi:DNA polymerase alpha subunit B
MDPITEQLNERFAPPSGDLGPVITGELQSILRIHSIDPEELSYKWESYCMKMGAEETTLDLKTVRDFKKDLQEALERETRGKVQPKGSERRTVGATPRAGMSSGDVFGAYVYPFSVYSLALLMVYVRLDGLLPNTPHSGARKGINGSTAKRRTNFETPAAKSNRGNMVSSPSDLRGAEELGTP